MTSVATKYDASSSFLARVCASLTIPRPPRGYWAKLEVGRAPAKPELPAPRPGDALEWTRDGSFPRIALPTSLPLPPASSSTRNQRKVGGHKLLVGARDSFDAPVELDSGHLRPRERCVVDLFVSRAALTRALDLAKALFVEIEGRGHRVAFASFGSCVRPSVDERSGNRPHDEYRHGTWSPDRPTTAYVGPVTIGLTIFEFSEEIEVVYHEGKYLRRSQLPLAARANQASNMWTTRRHMANGQLCLRASATQADVAWEQKWVEAKKGELKSRAEEIVAYLESSAPSLLALIDEAKRQAAIRLREWEEEQERWRIEELERLRAENLQGSRTELSDIIAAWAEARKVEDFFADVERRLTSFPPADHKRVLERIRQAREMLGGVDALARFRDWRTAEERLQADE